MDAHQHTPSRDDATSPGRKPLTVRVPRTMLARIEHAARRLGMSRSAFMLAATAERLERMEKALTQQSCHRPPL